MKDNIKLYQKREFHVFVTETYPYLIQLKKEGNREALNNLILKKIPGIKRYIHGRLTTAIGNGKFSKNKYNPDEFLDQLFIEVYDHIDEVNKADDFYLWLFKKTDELLEDVIVEEEFNEFFFKNIDDYSKPEWDEMEENFSTDGDGDLLMVDELDDISYNKNDYTLNHVFIEDDEDKYIEKLDKELSDAQVQKHIQMMLQKLPLRMQSVFDLFANHKFNNVEIAKIKRITTNEVDQLLQDARKILRASFLNRYKIDNE